MPILAQVNEAQWRHHSDDDRLTIHVDLHLKPWPIFEVTPKQIQEDPSKASSVSLLHRGAEIAEDVNMIDDQPFPTGLVLL